MCVFVVCCWWQLPELQLGLACVERNDKWKGQLAALAAREPYYLSSDVERAEKSLCVFDGGLLLVQLLVKRKIAFLVGSRSMMSIDEFGGKERSGLPPTSSIRQKKIEQNGKKQHKKTAIALVDLATQVQKRAPTEIYPLVTRNLVIFYLLGLQANL